MVLTKRHNSGNGPMLSPKSIRTSGLSRDDSSNVSLPYGSALSPTSDSASVHLSTSSMGGVGVGGSNSNITQRRSSHSSVYGSVRLANSKTEIMSPGAQAHPLSPTFFQPSTPQAVGKGATSAATKIRRAFFASNNDNDGRRRLSSSPSKGPRRNSSVSPSPIAMAKTILYYLTILGCGYFILTASKNLSQKEAKLKQMRNDYHILHHKVRETQKALTQANKVNHDLEDRSKNLAKTNAALERELKSVKKQKVADVTGVNPELLTGDAEDLSGLGSEEITNLLMRRQDAMKGRIGTLQSKIQEISRREAEERFGKGPHKVEVQVDFNAGVNTASRRDIGVFIIEMAPLDQMPHSVHLFLQMVAHKLWDDTVFLHTTHHVLQAAPIEFTTGRSKRSDFADAQLDQLSFQEYSDDYPHVKYTIGFGGRPGGPDFYISTQDNTRYHGPGGQGQHDLHEEADPCFGLVVEGHKIVDRMHRRSITTVGKNGEGWDGKDVPITSIFSMRVL